MNAVSSILPSASRSVASAGPTEELNDQDQHAADSDKEDKRDSHPSTPEPTISRDNNKSRQPDNQWRVTTPPSSKFQIVSTPSTDGISPGAGIKRPKVNFNSSLPQPSAKSFDSKTLRDSKKPNEASLLDSNSGPLIIDSTIASPEPPTSALDSITQELEGLIKLLADMSLPPAAASYLEARKRTLERQLSSTRAGQEQVVSEKELTSQHKTEQSSEPHEIKTKKEMRTKVNFEQSSKSDSDGTLKSATNISTAKGEDPFVAPRDSPIENPDGNIIGDHLLPGRGGAHRLAMPLSPVYQSTSAQVLVAENRLPSPAQPVRAMPESENNARESATHNKSVKAPSTQPLSLAVPQFETADVPNIPNTVAARQYLKGPLGQGTTSAPTENKSDPPTPSRNSTQRVQEQLNAAPTDSKGQEPLAKQKSVTKSLNCLPESDKPSFPDSAVTRQYAKNFLNQSYHSENTSNMGKGLSRRRQTPILSAKAPPFDPTGSGKENTDPKADGAGTALSVARLQRKGVSVKKGNGLSSSKYAS
ncbi:hypothetical protein VTO42DRAFT_8797 [Malbranchea cinnamomea]